MPEWNLVIHLQIPQSHVNWQPHFIQLNKWYWCVWPAVGFWSRLYWAFKVFVIKWSVNFCFEGNISRIMLCPPYPTPNHTAPQLVTFFMANMRMPLEKKWGLKRDSAPESNWTETFRSLNTECRAAHYRLYGHYFFFVCHIICQWIKYVSLL